MSGPGEAERAPLIEHKPPIDFPPVSFVSGGVPKSLNGAIVAATKKTGLDYWEQLLTWATKGAECERLHESKDKSGRTKRK